MSTYNFLGLVNDVNRRLNEVELSSTNFATAGGFYSGVKDAVNTAVRHINHSAFEWPFNHVTQEETLIPGEVRYFYPRDVKTVDYDSFRIKRNAAFGNDTKKLTIIPYEEYLDKFVDAEYSTDESVRNIPQYVFRTPSQEYGVYPPPKEAYQIVYEYYRLPVDMIYHYDVPTLPEQFRHIIVDGAMYYAYTFRGNSQDATLHQQKFDMGVKEMRTLFINRFDSIRDTRVTRSL